MYFNIQGIPSSLRPGWVDFDYVCSTVCQVLLVQMGNWQGSQAIWGSIQIQVNPSKVSDQMRDPVKKINSI